MNITVTTRRRRYGFWKFMFDLFMTAITGGLWILWWFFRGMRNR